MCVCVCVCVCVCNYEKSRYSETVFIYKKKYIIVQRLIFLNNLQIYVSMCYYVSFEYSVSHTYSWIERYQRLEDGKKYSHFLFHFIFDEKLFKRNILLDINIALNMAEKKKQNKIKPKEIIKDILSMNVTSKLFVHFISNIVIV